MARGWVVVVLLLSVERSVAQDLLVDSHEPNVAFTTTQPPASYADRAPNPRAIPWSSEPVIRLPDPEPKTPVFTHGVVYDQGWILRPFDSQSTPFELKIAFYNQFRYTGFDTESPRFIDSAGNAHPTPSRNDFGINRGRFIFSGYAIDPLLQYYANIDYNSVSEKQIQILLAWMRHPLSPAFNIAYGLGKVPGTWEWEEATRNTLGVERSMATTFFRPSITAGIWAEGELHPGVHYKALLGDGFNTLSLNASSLDTHFVYSGMLWWEPFGDFGPGRSDFESHETAVIRLGSACTFSRQDADPLGEPGPEQTVIRLSDGTRLVETGALAPGVTVTQFNVTLYTIHAGWKRGGCSLSGEFFLRWLTDLQATGPIPQQAIFDQGFFLQPAWFVVPQSVELFLFGSTVFGPFGDGYQYGGGLNWYIKQSRDWRFSMDVGWLSHCPAQQDRTGFVAGESGLLVRTQVSVAF